MMINDIVLLLVCDWCCIVRGGGLVLELVSVFKVLIMSYGVVMT